MQQVKVHHQYCRQTEAKALEPGADGTMLIVFVNGEGGKQKHHKVGREYRERENDKRMSPTAGKKHAYRLRKSTELTGIRLKIYRKRSASSSERKSGRKSTVRRGAHEGRTAFTSNPGDARGKPVRVVSAN